MANIVLRSPQHKLTTSHASANSAKMTITIDGTLRYTIIKECDPSSAVVFEIAELCRDYIDIVYTGIPTDPTIAIVTVITTHASTDGSGTALNTVTFNDVGFDGYGLFTEGANPNVVSSVPRWLIDFDPDFTGINDKYFVYIPNGYSGYVPLINTSNAVQYHKFSTTDTEVVGSAAGIKLNINRIDCTKYGNGHKIRFVNKYGAIQELWFFLKHTESTTRKQETFQRNIINAAGTYATEKHSITPLDTSANQTITLSSGYYPEWTNAWFEQLMLSEQVWLSDDSNTNATTDTVTPVTVKTSTFNKKTSVNDRLIEYTFEFELAADYINNIR